MRTFLFLLPFVLWTCTSSTTRKPVPNCDEINKNKVLINSPWDSKEYMNEMVDLLYKKKNIRYFYDGKIIKNGATLFVIKCVGDDFCGKILLFLGEGDKNSEKLQFEDNLGSELIGLHWHMDDLKYKLHFIYDSIDEIRKK